MSPPYAITRSDLIKFAWQAAYVTAAALLTWLANIVLPAVGVDYPSLSPLIGAGSMVLLNLARRFTTDSRPSIPEAKAAMVAADQKRADQKRADNGR